MLGVLLTILKILLWCILAIVFLVLLIVLLVLFMPIRYRLEGEFHEDYGAKAGVGWLGARVSGSFTKDQGLVYRVRFLGITLLSNQEAWTEKKASKAREKARKAARKARKREAAEEPETLDTPLEKVRENRVNPASPVEAPRGEESPPISAERNQKTEQTAEKEDSEKTEKTVIDEDSEKIAKSKKKEKASKQEKKPEEKPDSPDKKESLLQKLSNLKEKVETKRNHVECFLDKPFTKRTIDRGKKCLLKVFKTIRPRKAKGNLTLGLSNPADTGVVIGVISMFLPVYSGFLKIEPDFYHQTVEGELWLKGRIQLARIAFPALNVVIHRDFKRTLALAKKI